MTKTVEEVMSWHTFKPHGWGERFSKDQCAHPVHDTYGVGFHQCGFKPKETIEGYGFCKRHATAVKEALARIKK